MSRNYNRMPIEAFGKHLLDTNELDPIYVALTEFKRHHTPQQLHRWLIAYWCFYNAGFASYASEAAGSEFWEVLDVAAANTAESPTPYGARWPRGHERRHFRGNAAISAVQKLEERYGSTPEDMVTYCAALDVDRGVAGSCPYELVAGRTQEHALFGPWISFKVADMADRVLGAHVDFSEAEVFMFKDPVEAALRLWRERAGLPENAKPKDQALIISAAVLYLKDHFSNYRAPPTGDRPVGLQEVETILCKWKSHMNGHYPMFNDIIEIREGTKPWTAHSAAARVFLNCMPAAG